VPTTVKTRILVLGAIRRISSAACIPFITGMLISSRTRSGFKALTCSITSCRPWPRAVRSFLYIVCPRIGHKMQQRTQGVPNKLVVICDLSTGGTGMKDRSRTRRKFTNFYKREAFELLLRLAASSASPQTAVAQGGPEATELRALNICHNYHLSQREGETVRFLIEGLANKEIAARMGISPDTVKVFLRLAMMKMGVSSRSGIMSKFIHLKESDTGPGTETSRTVHDQSPT